MKKLETVNKIIKKFNLVPLRGEGGFFAEMYRSTETVQKNNLPSRYKSARHFSTSILYLITYDSCSMLHKVISDEIFHFYMGDSVVMLNLFQNNSSNIINLGSNIFNGEHIQYVVPANTWQGAKLASGGTYALLGTTVAPGFEFEDYVSAKPYKKELLYKYPDRAGLINELV
ncbi:MAG: cupin domain-containing protein [Actinomycetota bacterium]|nr:cupin domain-containing protein [Actinomycetota bacterium]